MSDMNIASRLNPLMKRFNELTGTEFLNDECRAQARVTVEGLGFFSIPMLEDLLSEAKRVKEDILCTDIPCLLAEYGIAKATLDDGTVVSKDLFYEVSQAGKDKQLLARWLIENGYKSTIKDTLSFDKGEFQDEILSLLREKGYSFSHDSGIHPQTLRKTIKEHMEAGLVPPPEDACKVNIFERGVVKAPKDKDGF